MRLRKGYRKCFSCAVAFQGHLHRWVVPCPTELSEDQVCNKKMKRYGLAFPPDGERSVKTTYTRHVCVATAFVPTSMPAIPRTRVLSCTRTVTDARS